MKHLKISGVYQLTNRFTGEIYVGSSINIRGRWFVHTSTLSAGKGVKKVQTSYDPFASEYLPQEVFELDVLERTKNMREQERYWYDKLTPTLNECRPRNRDDNSIQNGILGVSIPLSSEEEALLETILSPSDWAENVVRVALRRLGRLKNK